MSENEKKPFSKGFADDDPKYPERAAEVPSDRPASAGVYAGPVMPAAMVTYAGPGFMNNFGPAPIQNVFQPRTPQSPGPDEKRCGVCGSINMKEAKFCMECGQKFAADENREQE